MQTILILDNDPHCQWTLKTLLENEKYIALAVDKIERVLKDFQEFKISALITEYRSDHVLLEVVRRLKKRFPKLYVMMLTQESLGQKEYKTAIRAGIDDVFLKPISGEEILAHLKKGLRQPKEPLYKDGLEQRLSHFRSKKEIQIPQKNQGETSQTLPRKIQYSST